MQEITVEEKNEWKSCCLTVDRSMCMYAVQFTLALGVLAFSGVMLAMSEGNCEGARDKMTEAEKNNKCLIE